MGERSRPRSRSLTYETLEGGGGKVSDCRCSKNISDTLKSVSEGCHNKGPWTAWPKEWKLSYSSGGYVSEIKVLAGLVLFQGLSS